MPKLHNKLMKMKADLRQRCYGHIGIVEELILYKGELLTLLYTEPFVIVVDSFGSVFRLSSIDQLEEL